MPMCVKQSGADMLLMVQIEAIDALVMTAWLQTFILRERNR